MDIALLALGWVYALYVFFLAYVALHVAQKNGKLAAAPKVVQLIAWSILLLAVVADVGFNVICGSLIFLEWPSRSALTFSTRCSSHLQEPSWRGRIARWVCNGWLNPMDAGHCS